VKVRKIELLHRFYKVTDVGESLAVTHKIVYQAPGPNPRPESRIPDRPEPLLPEDLQKAQDAPARIGGCAYAGRVSRVVPRVTNHRRGDDTA
jgi:hypothetical protein